MCVNYNSMFLGVIRCLSVSDILVESLEVGTGGWIISLSSSISGILTLCYSKE